MKYIATLAAGMALAVPSSALAQSGSTCQAYNPQLCSVTAQTGNGTDSATASQTGAATTSTGTLPFTGLDAILLAAGGGTLAGAGLVVRRLSRRID
jgi:hypothetical protein